jgi:hypothetical protein
LSKEGDARQTKLFLFALHSIKNLGDLLMKLGFGKLLAAILVLGLAASVLLNTSQTQAASQPYTFKSVRTGAGGGFIVDVIFHPKQKDLIYAKTDIGGAYRWNPSTSTWTQLFNFVTADQWNWTGMESLAIDPSNPALLYAAGGTYTNAWSGSGTNGNGVIWRSSDQGNTWTYTPMPFKMGGNMNGRGMGERLAVDPNKGSILYFGARDGNGLWKSTDSGATWAQVTNFPDTGPFVANPADTNDYLTHPVGVTWVIFDPATGTAGNPTQTIYVGVAENNPNKPNIFRSTDGGATWAAIPGETTCNGAWGATVTCTDGATWTAGAANSYSGGGLGYLPHEGKVDSQGTLYVTYSDWEGPYNGGHGAVFKYVPSTNTWTNITPCTAANSYCTYGSVYFGFGGLGIDLEKPGTIVVAGVNAWWPDGVLFRTLDGGTTWSPIWTYNGYPSVTRHFKMDISSAPWLNMGVTSASDPTPPFKLGWMMEGLNIDPFNSDRMMYGTGATLYGTTNLTAWDTGGTVTLSNMAVGMEETSVTDLISPPSGTAHLISTVGDIGGWVHNSLDTAPSVGLTIPYSGTFNSVDFAESTPAFMVIAGTGNPSNNPAYHGTGFTYNSGGSWFSGNNDPVAGSGGGTIAAAADASRVVWAGTSAPVSYSSDNGNSWVASANIPAGSVVASDRVNANKFYGLGGGKFWVSTDKGATFTASAATGLPSTGNVKALFGHEGDIWIAGGSFSAGGGSTCNPCGIWHSTDSGATFTHLSSVTSAQVIGFGMASPTGSGYPAIFMTGTPTGGVNTIYRSDDAGATWIRLTDATHNYATIQTITGDPRIYGRVYFGTNGLGIVYGDIAGTTATNTPTSTSNVTNTPTKTATATFTSTSTATKTNTSVNTNTPTFVPPTNTATSTSTGVTATATKTATSTTTATATASATSGTAVSGVLKVRIENGGTDSNQQSQFNFLVMNTSATAQSNITVRIYFALDGTQPVSKYVMEKYWDQSGVATVTGPTLASGSIYYYTVSFGTTALAAGGSWQFNGALHLSDWSPNLDPSNDPFHAGYATGALPAAFTDTTHIPAYINGSLVWGVTP